MPLSALLAGPIAGGPWADGDDSPRAVREDWWDKVCQPEDIQVIYTDDAKGPIHDVPGDEVLEHWVNLLNQSPKRCVEVIAGPSNGDMFPQTFDLW